MFGSGRHTNADPCPLHTRENCIAMCHILLYIYLYLFIYFIPRYEYERK
jgi:hypothetical protein